MKRHLFVLCTVALACTGRVTPVFAQASALGSSFAIYGAVSRGSAVAYDTKNHVYLVVSAYGTVSARFVSADGTGLPYCISSGSNFTVGGAAFGHFPRVAYSPDANGGLGGFMVTWHEGDSVASGNAVHARAVSLAGCVGVDRIISNTIDGNGAVIGGDKTWWEAGPAIAYSTRSQRWLVVWRSIVSVDGQFNDVNGRILDLSGQPLGFSTVKVTNSSGYEDNPSVAYNPTTDEFLVTYSGEDGTSPYVAAKRVTSAGIVGPGYVLSRATGTYITDTTYVASTGNYFSAWHQVPGGATGHVVNGVTGAPEGAPIPLSTRFTANDAMSVAYNALSGTSFLVSHDQLTSEDGGFEISAAGVPSAGFGATSLGGKGNYYPRIAASSVDKRWMMVTANNFAAIFGQFISSTGVSVGPPPAAPPPSPPPPVAPPTVSLTANVTLPVSVGTPITWTATASGGAPPLQYQFMRYSDATGWSVAQAYSSSNSYTWFPPAGNNALQVWVRNSGSGATYDAYQGTGMFTILPPAKLMSFNADVAFPVTYNVPITFTARGTANTEYKFLIYTGTAGWKVGQDYSANNVFTWFPPMGQNAVQVWARTPGAPTDFQDWMSSGLFAVSPSPARLVSFSSNVAFPAAPTTTITWTAFATGGAVEYKFWRYDQGGAGWMVLRDWSSSNQVSWTPGAANSGWQAVQVWVRNAGSSLAYEDWRGTDFFLITTSTGLTSVPSRPLTGLKVGDLVIWTANVAGGAGPWEYKFLTYDYRGWLMQQDYSWHNTFAWYPPAGTCTMQVWVRAAGSHATWERYESSGFFVVNP
jgi:hypothetical protein